MVLNDRTDPRDDLVFRHVNHWRQLQDIAGLVAFLAANLISNLLFFQLGAPILFDPEVQAAKVMDVLFEMEPRPLMFENGPLYMAYGLGVGVIHGLVFMMIETALGQTRLQRGLRFAVVLWALMALYFKFHTPFKMFREPLQLVGLELFFWVFVALAEGLVLSFSMEEAVMTWQPPWNDRLAISAHELCASDSVRDRNRNRASGDVPVGWRSSPSR